MRSSPDDSLEFVLDATGAILWDWDPVSDERTESANAHRVFGLPEGVTNADGAAFLARVHDSDRESVRAAVDRAVSEGMGYQAVYRVVHPNGAVRWLQDAARVSRDSDGRVRLSGVLMDITPRKQVEAQVRELDAGLRRQAQELQAVLDVLPVGIFIAEDPECNSIRGNPAGAKMLGIDRDTNASKSGPRGEGLPFRVLRDGAEVPAEELPMQQAARTGVPVMDVELDITRDDGVLVRLLEYAIPLFDEEGRVRGCVGAFVDITERRLSEEALRKSEERHALVLAATQDGIWDWDLETRRVWCSSRFQEMLGFDAVPVEMADESLGELVHPEDLPRMAETLTAHIGGKTSDFVDEQRMRHRDGSYRWMLTRGRIVRDASGRAVRIVGAKTDLTARMEAEAAVRDLNTTLRRRLEELEALIDHSPVGIAIAEDPSFRKVQANRVLRELLHVPEDWNASPGAPPEERGDCRSFHDGQEAPEAELPMRRAVTTGLPVENAEIDIIRRDGTRRSVLNSAQPLFDESGEVRGCISFYTDITARKRAEDALRESDRRKDEFLATLAHELRNPLAPIRTAVEVMRLRDFQDPKLDRARAIIERQTEQLSRLVDDLLDISRITQGRLELRRERVSVEALIDRALETSAPIISALGHRLETHISPGLFVDADPIRIAQVFSNLLDNAAKYTPPEGNLELRAAANGQTVVFQVRDDGIGVHPDMLGRIFEPFTQVDASNAQTRGGLGIGLSLARRLVKMHGGRIEVTSPGPGRGTLAEVQLPLAEGVAVPAQRLAATQLRAAPCRVLIADDNRDAADSLAALLEIGGNEVRTAYDGLEALSAALEFLPDVALLDLGMPGLSGYELARRLRERAETRGIALIALTGWGQERDRQRSEEAGFDHHLVKPVSPEHLESLLASLSPRHRTD